MNKQHKHAELIKAWADGSQIEYRMFKNDDWYDVNSPSWDGEGEYRIKPEPKPDVIQYQSVSISDMAYPTDYRTDQDNIRLTFDGETGKLKAVELL